MLALKWDILNRASENYELELVIGTRSNGPKNGNTYGDAAGDLPGLICSAHTQPSGVQSILERDNQTKCDRQPGVGYPEAPIEKLTEWYLRVASEADTILRHTERDLRLTNPQPLLRLHSQTAITSSVK